MDWSKGAEFKRALPILREARNEGHWGKRLKESSGQRLVRDGVHSQQWRVMHSLKTTVCITCSLMGRTDLPSPRKPVPQHLNDCGTQSAKTLPGPWTAPDSLCGEKEAFIHLPPTTWDTFTPAWWRSAMYTYKLFVTALLSWWLSTCGHPSKWSTWFEADKPTALRGGGGEAIWNGINELLKAEIQKQDGCLTLTTAIQYLLYYSQYLATWLM